MVKLFWPCLRHSRPMVMKSFMPEACRPELLLVSPATLRLGSRFHRVGVPGGTYLPISVRGFLRERNHLSIPFLLRRCLGGLGFPFEEGCRVSLPEQDGLQRSPYLLVSPVFTEDVRWVQVSWDVVEPYCLCGHRLSREVVG